jgi:2Fe-2S ferredoxin
MPRIVFIEPGGARREIDAPVGITLMEAARQHDVAGVVAQCGGACACATCHVYVDKAWLDKLEPVQEMEKTMLDFAEGVETNSRLSCQIKVSDALNGLVVRTPKSQH